MDADPNPPPSAFLPPPEQRPPKSQTRRNWLIAAGVVLLLLVLAFGDRQQAATTPGAQSLSFTPQQQAYLTDLRALGLVIPGPVGNEQSALQLAQQYCASPMSRSELIRNGQTRAGWSPTVAEGVVNATVEHYCPGRVFTPEGPKTTFGEGTHTVGTDIAPGTYKTQGAAASALPNCYWARLSGTSGELSEILANSNETGPTTVTIKRSDKAFKTSGCVAWTKVG